MNAPECPGPNCPCCSGEYCRSHTPLSIPCDCDTADRHAAPIVCLTCGASIIYTTVRVCDECFHYPINKGAA